MATNTIILSWIASGIYNLDSQRFRRASLDKRREGWTETWGSSRNKISHDKQLNSEEDGRQKSMQKVELDEESLSQILSTPYPQVEIVLTQHRPAWFEQMLMRVAGIPHIVLNSNHISNEATGQLPYLRDYMSLKGPVLVGRRHPTTLEKNCNIINNSILEYLRHYRNVDLDKQAGFTTEQQRGLSRGFQSIITLELSNVLSYLRFEDSDSWDQVYRPQYIEASKHGLGFHDTSINWGAQLRGRFQASMERNVERRRLSGFYHLEQKKSIRQILELANQAYSTIDRQLLCVKEQDKTNLKNIRLLGTDKPALVDVMLWSHLADALCDAHLVVLLASYPRLVQYFQEMYQEFFPSSKGGPDEECAWKHWNEKQNLSNAFQKIPSLSKCNLKHFSLVKDAVDLMHKSSLQKQDLQEVLEAVKVIRTKEPQQKERESETFTLYRWCMGGISEGEHEGAVEARDNPLRRKILRDQLRNDQMWISGIVGISAIAIFLIRGRA